MSCTLPFGRISISPTKATTLCVAAHRTATGKDAVAIDDKPRIFRLRARQVYLSRERSNGKLTGIFHFISDETDDGV
jgi:hypothetical protein